MGNLDGQAGTPAEVTPDGGLSGANGIEELRTIVVRTRELVRSVSDGREATLLVRRSSTAQYLIHEALKTCSLLEEQQFELRQEAAETHLRTQRRAGELLAQLPLHRGGRPPSRASRPDAAAINGPTLKEMGIDVHESHRWQRIASLPADVFEEHLAARRSRRVELTTSDVLALARRRLRKQHEADGARAETRAGAGRLQEFHTLKRQAFAVIWLDPVGLAASMEPARRDQALDDVEDLLLWLIELRDALG